MDFSRFEDFAPLFERGPAPAPGYLLLLGVTDETWIAVRQLRTATIASGDRLGSLLRRMLEELNWRPQLVAASAILVAKFSEGAPALWSALDRPCWTSPQLVAVASRIDPNFCLSAKSRLETRCKMDSAKASEMTPPARHSALGPSSLVSHSAKLASALVALCAERDCKMWLDELTSQPDFQSLLNLDVDRAGSIALRWRAGMDAFLAGV